MKTDVDKIQAIWPHAADQWDYALEEYNSFLAFLNAELRAFDERAHEIHPLTSDDILRIIETVRSHRFSSRKSTLDAVKRMFAARAPSDAAISKSVNLATGLWLNVKIQPQPTQLLPGCLRWNSDQSLNDLLERGFQIDEQARMGTKENVQIDLTIEKLATEYDYTVLWTSNLLEHLMLDKTARNIKVYEHKICLRNHGLAGDQTALPQSVVSEAIDTLNLLFPLGEGRTDRFLKKHKKNFASLGNCGRRRCLDLNKYKIWRDNLEKLCEVLDEEPVGVRQFVWWQNGKNALQFATFWIAAAVAILTIVSFATGVASVVYAKKSYDIAVMQYQLSLAQACVDPQVASKLTSWC